MDTSADTVRSLAHLAGVPLPEERAAALARTLSFIQASATVLAQIDYRDAGPVGAFRPPPAPEAPK